MTNSKHLNANQNIFKSTKLSVLDNLVHCVTKNMRTEMAIYTSTVKPSKNSSMKSRAFVVFSLPPVLLLPKTT